jgi:hypothetical protein
VPYTDPSTLEVTHYPSALAWVQEQVARNPDATTVVLEYGGACGICDLWIPGSVTYGSDAFYSTWSANAKVIIDWLHAQGKTVLWVKSPQSGASGDLIASGKQYRVDVARWLSAFDEGILAPYAGTPVIDWYYALNDVDGRFQQDLYYDNATHRVRADDLVHLATDGSVRASTWTLSTLGTYWDSEPNAQLAMPTPVPNRLIEAGDPVVPIPMWGTP